MDLNRPGNLNPYIGILIGHKLHHGFRWLLNLPIRKVHIGHLFLRLLHLSCHIYPGSILNQNQHY